MSHGISFQPELPPYLPEVRNNKEFRDYCKLLSRIDYILRVSGLDFAFASEHVNSIYRSSLNADPNYILKEKHQQKHAAYALTALRCNILGKLTQESFRKLSTHIAESGQLQQFCKIIRLGKIHAPSKSKLQRFMDMFTEPYVRSRVVDLIHFASDSSNPLNLEERFNTDDVFLDGTCLKANIHYPVDWLLLRDGILTILKAVLVIRRHGLKHRIGNPSELMRRVNRLSIEMTHTRRKKDSVKARKRIFRELKKLEKTIRAHGVRYRNKLNEEWASGTDLTEKQVRNILARLDNVLNKLPDAVTQAHQRIITGLRIPSEHKILSLYDDSVRVIVRGKAGSEVEFGNTLFLAEQQNGVILDWKLYDASVSDNLLTKESLQRIEEHEFSILTATADRGCDTLKNRQFLERKNIFNGLCPRNPQELAERMKNKDFLRLQNRRSQTEGRIGIFKNNIIGSPIRNKFFEYKESNIAWGVLAHNLWVLARLPENMS